MNYINYSRSVRIVIHVVCLLPAIEVVLVLGLVTRAILMLGWVGYRARSPFFVSALNAHASLVNSLLVISIFCVPGVIVALILRRWEPTRIATGWAVLYALSSIVWTLMISFDALGLRTWVWG